MTWRQPEYLFKLTIDDVETTIDEPEGFDEIQSRIFRDEKSHGMFFEATPADIPLKFSGTGKILLAAAFDNGGVDSESSVEFNLWRTTPFSVGTVTREIVDTTENLINRSDFAITVSGRFGQSFVVDRITDIVGWRVYISGGTSITADVFVDKLIYNGNTYQGTGGYIPSGNPTTLLSDVVINSDQWTDLTFEHGPLYPVLPLTFDPAHGYTPPQSQVGYYIIYLTVTNKIGVTTFSGTPTKAGIDYDDYYLNGQMWIDTGSGTIVGPSVSAGTIDCMGHITLRDRVELRFTGNVDFSNAKEDQDYFYCSLLRSDLLVSILNNRSKRVNLLSGSDIYGNWAYPADPKTLSMHSFKLQKLFSCTINSGAEITDTGNELAGDAYVTLNIDNKVLEEVDESQSLTYEFVTSIGTDNTSAFWIVVDEPGDMDISFIYDIDYRHWVQNSDLSSEDFTQTVKIKAQAYDWTKTSKGAATTLATLLNVTNNLDPAEINDADLSAAGTGTATITGLNKYDYVLLYIAYETVTDSSDWDWEYHCQFTETQTIAITIQTTQAASTAKGLLAYDALQANLRIITGQIAPLNSDFFDAGGCGYYNFITNGKNIRKFEHPIVTSWDELFEGLQSIFGLGYGMDSGQIKVGLWEDFYIEDELIDLGDVGDYTEQVVGDKIMNEVRLGFNSYADDENLSVTLEDFHTESTWSTPIVNHRGIFTQMSPVLCSSFLIESVRRQQYAKKPTTANKWDDNIFMIACEEPAGAADYDAETDDPFDLITGLTNSDTAYNLRHTIKRMLLNWGVWINSFSMRYKSSAATVRNTFFKNNGSLTTKLAAAEGCVGGDVNRAVLTEKADITKGNIQGGEAKFDQEIITFTKVMSDEQLDTIKDGCLGQLDDYPAKNFGYITVNDYNGDKQKGWLLDLEYNIYDQVGKFTLLKRYSIEGTGRERLLESGTESRLLEDDELRLLEE